MNIKEALIYGMQYLKNNDIDESILKSKILLSYILGVEKEYLISNDTKQLEEEKEKKYIKSIKELSEGKPIQYITNKQEFMKLNFFVNEDVLIPQPDTEILVEKALEIVKPGDSVLDLCTGSGIIGICIKKYNKDVKVYASDISEKALDIAKQNAKQNDVEISFIQSDLFENIKDLKFNIIVSNPPYIEKDIIEKLDKEVLHEPIIALDGGIDGLDFYRKIASDAKKYLKLNGKLILEIGYNQREDVIKILRKEGYKNISCKKDLAGLDRVIICRR